MGQRTGRTRAAWMASLAAATALSAGCASIHGPKSAAADARRPKATPSTTTRPPASFPLTGLPAVNGVPDRPALSIKIDNAVPTRPQTNLNKADIVVQELVEGGVTRFLAIFQSGDASPIGPIRSARPTDADLLRQLGGGIFAYSGAAPGEIAPVKARSTATLISDEAGSAGFFRSHDRVAPYNLFATTDALYRSGMAAAHGRHLGPPPPLFTYGPTPASARTVTSVYAQLSNRSTMGWQWSPTQRQFLRSQDNAPHMQSDGVQVSADDVVLMSVEVHGSGVYDVVKEEDPVMTLTGTGEVWVLRDGAQIHGRWDRPDASRPAQLLDDAGHVIALHAGRTWVELLNRTVQPTLH